jgi:TonB-linked SusC/RagA family outer membrane protein
MRKNDLNKKQKLFAATFVCMLLALQSSAQVTSPQKDTVTVENNPDSVAKKQVQLVYYSVPSKLTAASTGVVYNKDIIKSPVTNVINAVTGRLAGIYTQQFSGQPLADGASISLHGRTPIVLIDGVARNLSTIDLEEIESVTVLKDALSTAMLGVRGANGAIAVTTKKGLPGRQIISFTAQSAIQQPLGMPKTLGAYDYAVLRNEAVDNEVRVNPNFNASSFRYSATDLQAFADKTDPYGHPDVNWQDQLLKEQSKLDRYNLNLSAGNKWARFFVNLEHLNQQGLLKENEKLNPNYSTNVGIKSYIARTNVDLNITPKLTGGISIFGRIIDGNEPGGFNGTGLAGIFNGTNGIFTTPNSAYPVYTKLTNADSIYSGNVNYQNNLQAQSVSTGQIALYRRDLLSDFYLKRTLDEVVKGLWVKARLSYSSNLTETVTRTKPVVVFEQLANLSYQKYGNKTDQLNGNALNTQGRSTYSEFSAGYTHTFSTVHGIEVLLMYNKDNIVNGSDLPYIVKGTSGRVGYNYKQKYILEVAYAYNGSNRYPENGATRYGFFPSVGAAWNITNEDFAKKIKWLNYLKLYASYGKAGNDDPGYFSYLQRYGNNTQAIFGTSAGAGNTLVQQTIANRGITWEKANKANIGLQGTLINNQLGFTVEYYNNKFYDLLTQRGRSIALLGSAYPNENIGVNRYTGVDLEISWQNKPVDKLHYYIAANASIQKSEVLFFDEVSQPYAHMVRTGASVGRPFGYIADGLFQSAAEIAGAATLQGFIPQPGDIRYKDLNSDGVINQFDQAAIGTDKPLITYGISMGLTYQSFDLSALIQGVSNRDSYLSGNTYFEFQNNGRGQVFEHHLDRWTPANTSGSYPRLSIGSNANNHQFSSYWMRKGDYMRLKNVEIGYSLPVKIIARAKLSAVRVFVNGLNLLTTSALGDIDPEVYGNYPLQRLYNFGINIKF